MKELDLNKINALAPYNVVKANRPNYFRFISKAGAEFAIGFDEDDFISSESYQFIIVNSNGKHSPNDIRVRDTIFAIVNEFFRVNNVTMLYICETSDGKQAMRSRLFSYWFTTLADKGKYSIYQSSIVDEGGVDNYFAVITRTDNPFAKQVMNEFYDNLYFFSHKPE